MRSQSSGYQGYPYINPPVVEAPSVDPASAAANAARWSSMPRRQVTRSDKERVVFINIPQDLDRPSRINEAQNPTTSNAASSANDIITEHQLPDRAGGSNLHQTDDNERDSQDPVKDNPDDDPVVYIDLPSDPCGGNAAHAREEIEAPEPGFLQDTIFYDPFDDRRIDMPKENPGLHSIGSETDSASGQSSSVRRPAPERPTTLEINRILRPAPTPNSPVSAGTSINSTPSSRFPDGYHLNRATPETSLPSPLPVTAFPEPPPAYTEIDATPSPLSTPPHPQDSTPPRTQVITATPISGDIANSSRKYLDCHHCGMRVHTLVVREIGLLNHVIALICLVLCLLPFICLVYLLDCFKNHNHYCPNCNKVIGYQLPFNYKKIFYVS